MDHEKQVQAQICQFFANFYQFCAIHYLLGLVNLEISWFSVDNDNNDYNDYNDNNNNDYSDNNNNNNNKRTDLLLYPLRMCMG